MSKQTYRTGSDTGVALAIFALCAVMSMQATADWSTEVYTNVANGVEWTYKIDTEAGTAYLVNRAEGAIVEKTTAGVLCIPDALEKDDTSYSVTAFGTLAECANLTGVVFPKTTLAQTATAATFQGNAKSVAVWFRGPETVSSGTQPVASVASSLAQAFSDNQALRAVVLGPNVGPGEGNTIDEPMFAGCSNVKVFVPAARWGENGESSVYYYSADSQAQVIRYGAGMDIDISIDGTFTVTTTNRLDDVLSVANYLHDYCGMNPKIVVTNVTEIAEGLITADRLPIAASDSLTFAVRNQAELNAVLAAVPDGMTFGIDCTGATEDVKLSSESEDSVWLKLPQSREHLVDIDTERVVLK